jgi:pilus assembly protein CpaF
MSLLRRMEKLQQEAAARAADASAAEAPTPPASDPAATLPADAQAIDPAAAPAPAAVPGEADAAVPGEADPADLPAALAPAPADPAPDPASPSPPSAAAVIAAAAAAATAAATGVPTPPPATAPATVTGTPAAMPAAPQAARMAARSAVREDLLRDIRIRLRAEAARSSASLAAVAGPDLRGRIEAMVDRVIGLSGYAVTRDERLRLIEDMVAGIQGLGPIEAFLKDETITEVMVNGPEQIYIERAGKIELTDAAFLNDDHVLQIIDRIVSPIGRRIDQSSPRVDARLPDGSRVNVIIEPLSLVGPVITIRKFSAHPYTVDDLIRFGTATAEMFDFLRVCVEARLNIFVSGGTGSGKTTTLNVLSSFIPEDERIVTIEDAAELQLRQEHVVTLESRPSNLEGEGEITIRDLLRNALHMRPDRIIVGECRGGEALDMIQAMTVGHEGSLSTGHANSPADMLRRLETMVLMAGVELPLRSIREQIASAVDVIVHTARLKDGSRKVVNITEVFGIEDDRILLQDVFAFQQTGVRDGRVEGALKPTGIRPTFMGRFKANGIQLPPGEFGIPAFDPSRPGQVRPGKSRWASEGTAQDGKPPPVTVGHGRVAKAGGMVYVSAMGPVDPESGQIVGVGIKDQTRQCMRNVQARLEAEGSGLARVAWASWALRDPSDFDAFDEEWVRWFPGDAPVGQATLMTPAHRRAGFRVSIGVIAEVGPDPAAGASDAERARVAARRHMR